jgi:4-hydroxythreonine-4-phosphate dehydrogenase
MTEPFHSFCIVADDLSGAADCAAAFAPVAGPVPVFLGEVRESTDSLAMDTDSRTMDTTQAVAVTARAFEQVVRGGLAGKLVYKKIDTTLRGHVGAELHPALDAAPQFAAAVIAPAFPEQGRTLQGGQLRVQGRPAENLGHPGDLIGMLHVAGLDAARLGPRQEPPELARRIAEAVQGGARVIVADALDRSDLERLADALCSSEVPRLLVAGSAGLARSLAAHVQPRTPGPASGEPQPAAGPVMIVVGSFSNASNAQVQEVRASGDAQVIRLRAAQWVEQQHAALRQKTLVIARDHLRNHRDLLLGIEGEIEQPFSRSTVRAMARLMAPLLQYAGTCLLTGGDTARAMFNELGVDRLDVSGEFEPGIPIGRAAGHAAAFVVKAGGFGDALVLQRIIHRFGVRADPPPARPPAPT